MKRRASPLFRRDHLQLGLFAANCSGGLAITRAPGQWDNSWDNNLALARLADARGMDFHLPVARWIGSSRKTGFRSSFMRSAIDPTVWATAILAATGRMTVFTTVHTAMHHPIAAAKAAASADQVGHGRFGMNIVCGWNKPEYDMFGFEFLQDHVDKYDHGQEWWDIVQRLWAEDTPFDHNGRYWTLKHVHGEPKTVDGCRPPIINAGASEHGRDFAVRNSDFILTVFGEFDDGVRTVRAVNEKARTYGRSVGVIAHTNIVCRPTMKEARDFDVWYSEEMADWDCVDYNIALLGIHGGHMPPEQLKMFRRRFAQGFGGMTLVGDPDHVAAEYKKFFDAGFAGCVVVPMNYLDEFPYFADEVLPRLERLGVRRKADDR